MSKPELYLMCGLSGSGKTTFARQFAALRHLRYINPDDFYALFNGDECAHHYEFEVWMALFRALHMAEQDEVSTVFDTNSLSVVDRVQILDWFPDFDHHLISINASSELCMNNNRSRRRVIPDTVMAQMIERFQIPDKTEWESEHRWLSITTLRNESNSGYTLVECRHRCEEQPIVQSTIEQINLYILADQIRTTRQASSLGNGV